jgi:hypothetical protein
MTSLISPQSRPEFDPPGVVSAHRERSFDPARARQTFPNFSFTSCSLRVAMVILSAAAGLMTPGLTASLRALSPQAPGNQAQPASATARTSASGGAKPASPAKKAAHHHHRASAKAAHARVKAAAPAPVVQAKLPPPRPKFPAFDHAAEASVVWDAHGLSIDATNSSLQQIMSAVSTDIGVKVDGLSADQRVFGKYGPGKASDVLSQLLQGSGYNVLMVGDQGEGTPREVMLSQRQNTAAQAAPRSPNSTDGGADDEEQPEEPPAPRPDGPPFHPNFTPGGPPRSPQQIMQDMQQRQQQQQQEQPNQQPN